MDFWSQHGGDLETLAIYAVAITVYTLLVTWLYVPMSQRLMFAKELGERRLATPGRRLAYVFLFPLVSFAFFLIVSAAMLFLSNFTGNGSGGAGLQPQDALVIAMATVLAIRLCAYLNEKAADELAKVMPLGLIGVALLVNPVQDTQLEDSIAKMGYYLDNWQLVGVFFLIVVGVEFLLRIVYELAGRPKHRPAPRPNEPLHGAPNRSAPPPALPRRK